MPALKKGTGIAALRAPVASCLLCKAAPIPRDEAAARSDPIRLVPSQFVLAIAIGTLLLSLPIATVDGTRAPFLTALFTATSAIAVTGLVVVDIGSYW